MLDAIANIAGAFIDKAASRNAAGLNRDMQREFAQKGIRWKVEDARAAGLHPLAALGAQTSSFQPTFVGGGLGEGLAAAGQDISRAMDATRTADERRLTQTAASAAAELAAADARETARAQRALLASQTALADAQAADIRNRPHNQVGPPMPSGKDAGISGTGVMVPDKELGAYKQKLPEIPTARPGSGGGMLAGAPLPGERTISFRGNTYRIPNVEDVDSLMEEPAASFGLIAALNPGLTSDVIEDFMVNRLGFPAIRGPNQLGYASRYWYGRSESEHINRVRKGWRSTPPIGH